MPGYVDGLVSVVIPTYRQSSLLSRAITSVLCQSYKNIELMVVNDNEIGDSYTEAVKKVISQFHDDRLHLVLQERHINGAAARNAGIKASKGQYIAFLDDDDYWAENKIELQVKMLAPLDDSWGGIACKNIALKNGRVYRALPPFREGDICERILLRRTEISTDCIMLRREALDQTGYFDERLQRNQEVQLLTNFTKSFKMKLLDEYLVFVDSSTSPNQPSPARMEQIKKDYLASVEPVIKSFPANVQKRICIMHTFEVGLLMLRNEMKAKGLKKCAQVLRSPFTLFYSIEYVRRKMKAARLAKSMEHFAVKED